MIWIFSLEIRRLYEFQKLFILLIDLLELIHDWSSFFFKIPNDAEKLKKIGSFCLTTKQKDSNCDQMLNKLKSKFKSCEHSPKTDQDCQSFKMNFCSAFSKFPCCVDVRFFILSTLVFIVFDSLKSTTKKTNILI